MSNCGCNGKTYNLSMGCCQPVLGPVENYYTKYQVDELISGITCCITEEEVDDKISASTSGLQETLVAGDNIVISGNVISANVPSLSGYATEEWVLDQHYITGVNLSDYYTKQETDDRIISAITVNICETGVHDYTSQFTPSGWSGGFNVSSYDLGGTVATHTLLHVGDERYELNIIGKYMTSGGTENEERFGVYMNCITTTSRDYADYVVEDGKITILPKNGRRLSYLVMRYDKSLTPDFREFEFTVDSKVCNDELVTDAFIEHLQHSGETSGCCITPEEVDEKISSYTYSKTEIDEKIISGGTFDPTQYYTTANTYNKTEVNNIITSAITDVESEIPSLSGYATQQWVLDKHYITGVDLSDYVTNENLSSYTYSKEVIDQKVASGGTFDPTMYYTTANTYNKTEVNNFLDGKLDASAYTPTDLSQYWTSAQTNSAITQATSGKVNVGDAVTAVEPLHGSATVGAIVAQVTGGSNAGYKTLATAGSGITIDKNAKISADFTTVQEKLVAGNNITISGNVISSTGGGSGTTYTAGHAIDITNNVISFGLPMSAGTGTGAIIVDDPNNVASGDYSIAYGSNTSALTEYSYVTGYKNKAVGLRAYVEGANNSASGNVSHVQGELNEAKNYVETANGLLNVSTKNQTINFGNSGATLFSIGNGRFDSSNPSNNVRHNAVEVKQNGDVYIANTCQTGNWYELPMMKLQDYLCSIPKFWCGTQAQYDAITTKDANTIYMIHS